MRVDRRNIYKYDIIAITAKCIYQLAPYNDPIDMDKIMRHVIDRVTEKCVNATETRYEHNYIFMTYAEFGKWFTEMINECQEFKNLNLSLNEREANISVDDPNRAKFRITSGFEEETEDSLRDDFVDLDACVGNILHEIYKNDEETDCFLCDRHNSGYCKTCVNNKSYSNHYYHMNTPYAEDKFKKWCKYGCNYSKAICCDDCDEVDCDYRCKESCNTCELMRENKNYKE